MKKLFGLGCALLCLAACNNEAPVFGDRTAKPTLSVVSVVDDLGNDFSDHLAQAVSKDTVLSGGKVARLTDFPLFLFRRPAHNVTIHVLSNSRWTATPPYDASSKAKWFMNDITNFIGDGKVVHYSDERNAQSTRKVQQVYYTTLDSTQIIRFRVRQMGLVDDPI